MKKYRIPVGVAFFAALALTGGAAQAEEDEDNPDGWSGELSAGFLAAGGNSESRATNAKAEVGLGAGSFAHSLSALAIQNRDSGETTAERYGAEYKVEFSVTERDFMFFLADFDKDLFGGVRRRTTQSAGYGRRLIQTARQDWTVELGAGARQLRFQRPEGGSESEPIGRFFTEYGLKLSEHSSLGQSVRVEHGESNTQTESETKLLLSIVGNLFASLSYTLRHNSELQDDALKKVDTFTAVNLSYAFGG